MEEKNRLQNYVGTRYNRVTIFLKKEEEYDYLHDYRAHKNKTLQEILTQNLLLNRIGTNLMHKKCSDLQNKMKLLEENIPSKDSVYCKLQSMSKFDFHSDYGKFLNEHVFKEGEDNKDGLTKKTKYWKYIINLKKKIQQRQMKKKEYLHLLNTGEQALFEEFCNKVGIERRLE